MYRLCLLLAGLAWFGVPNAQTAAVAPGAPLPIEYFSKHDEFGGLKISPDGKFYAVMAGKYGRSQLAFIQIEGMKIVSALRSPDGFEIDEFHWVSDTRLIYTIAERQPGRL